MTDLRRDVLRATSQQDLDAAADKLVQHGTPADIAYVVAHTHYPGPVFGALGVALVRGADVWPVIEALLDQPSNDVASFVASWLRTTNAQRFATIVAAAPELAARTAEAVEGKDFPAIAAMVVQLAAHPDALVRHHARRALRYNWAVPMTATAERLLVAEGVERTELAFLIARDRVFREEDLDDDLDDPRPWMRLAVVQALQLAYASRWSYVLAFATDEDPAVRSIALATIRERAEQDAKLLPSPEIVRGWLTCTSGQTRDEIVAVLSYLALRAPQATRAWGLPARKTRACATCGGLSRYVSWSLPDSAPKGFTPLVLVHGDILRCPECAAHFTCSRDVEYEVTSERETYTLVRMTLRDAAPHLDRSHPRVIEWAEALLADLDHPEPMVRAAAAWEIARDACAEKQFARVEELLLHHPAIEVVCEGLAELRSSCQLQGCPVSRDVLAVLAAHPNAGVQHGASFLLTVNDPSWTLRHGAAGEGQLEALHGLREANAIAPLANGLALVQAALRARPSNRWSFFPQVAALAFAGVDRAECAAAVFDALPNEPAAWLAEHVPAELRGTADSLRRALAAKDLDVVTGCVSAGAPLALAEAFFIAALAKAEHEQIANAIKAAFRRGDVCDALFVPLCMFCERRRPSYDAMRLIADWTAARDVPAKDALPILLLLVDEASGSFHEDVVRATTSIYLRTKDHAGLLAMLTHELYSTRGYAAGTIGKANAVVSAAVHSRLTEMAETDHWYPKGEAKTALRLVSRSSA